MSNTEGLRRRPAASPAAEDADDAPASRYECHICLDEAAEPVLTMCGHLYCWQCLYHWLHPASGAPHTTCPVCKAGVTTETVIPIYARGKERRDPRDHIPGPINGGGGGGGGPSMPAASPAPPRPRAARPAAPGPAGNNAGGGMQWNFNAGFGFLPGLFGLQFQAFGGGGGGGNNAAAAQEFATPLERQQAFVSKCLLTLGSLVIMVLLLF